MPELISQEMSMLNTILTSWGPFFRYFLQLASKLIPLLIFSVFLAELSKLRLGEERLRLILSGRRSWEGRFRAALLGALLPFCECGAFPVMVGLLKAGVSLRVTLTFFLISPVVSLPAIVILTGFFGYRMSLLYLAITITTGLIASYFLEKLGSRRGVFQEAFLSREKSGGCGCTETQDEGSCCSGQAMKVRQGLFQQVPLAWKESLRTTITILPLSILAMAIASVLHSFVPSQLIERVLSFAAPFDVPVAALAGIPIYNGDCAMIALVSPLISATGAIGPGIAFIIAGAGTSINGIVFMKALFKFHFLLFYILAILVIAIISGFLLALV